MDDPLHAARAQFGALLTAVEPVAQRDLFAGVAAGGEREGSAPDEGRDEA